MRLPILLGVPAREFLRESAAALGQGRVQRMPADAAKMVSGYNFQIDDDFSAVPLGSIEKGFAGMEALQAETSEDFAIRGSIEVESTQDVPFEIQGRPVFSDPMIAPYAYCASGPQGAVGNVTSKLDVSGLQQKGLDGKGVALAIMDTGINLAHLKSKLGTMPAFDVTNSWRPAGSTTSPGSYPVDHGTMCAFDALIAAPKATLIDYPVLATAAPGGNITGRTISVAIQAFAHLLANYAVAFAPGGTSRYQGLVVNNSWGIYHPSWDFPVGHPGRYSDNPQHPFATIVGALATAGVDILFAAGNCGADCPDGRCNGRSAGAIMGASAYPTVLTVAACLATNEDRLGYSSQGPSIAGMYQEKPDVTAYSHFLGSEAFGIGVADSGTSTACPVAAGVLAAIRTKLPPLSLPPANLFDQVRATARQAAGLAHGWNADFGHGIIDPVSLANSVGL